MAATDIDKIIEDLGFGCMQYLICGSGLATQMYVTNEQFGIGLLLVASTCDFEITSNRAAWLMIALMATQLLSAFFMGFKADTIGRRKVMLFTMSGCMACSFVSALMPNYWLFLLMRSLVGLL